MYQGAVDLYQAGKYSIFDVLNAQQTYQANMSKNELARIEYFRALNELAYALGNFRGTMGKLIQSLLLALLFTTGCEKTPEIKSKKSSAIPVKTAKATEKNLQSWIEAAGKVTPAATIEIRPRVRGAIQEILIKEGKNRQ